MRGPGFGFAAHGVAAPDAKKIDEVCTVFLNDAAPERCRDSKNSNRIGIVIYCVNTKPVGLESDSAVNVTRTVAGLKQQIVDRLRELSGVTFENPVLILSPLGHYSFTANCTMAQYGQARQTFKDKLHQQEEKPPSSFHKG